MSVTSSRHSMRCSVGSPRRSRRRSRRCCLTNSTNSRRINATGAPGTRPTMNDEQLDGAVSLMIAAGIDYDDAYGVMSRVVEMIRELPPAPEPVSALALHERRKLFHKPPTQNPQE